MQKRLYVFIFMLLTIRVFAGNLPSLKEFINAKDWSFVENKGQLVDEKGNIISDVKYYSYEGEAHLYCRPGKISLVFEKIDYKNGENISEATGTLSHAGGGRGWISERERETERQRVTKTTNRIDLTLLNSNPNAEILASEKQDYYENYYTTGNADSGITNVHTYKTITYKNIYPHIDMVLHAKPGGMKYEFIVNPGGEVSDIQLHWNGLDGIEKLKDSKMEYSFALGRMEESSPVSFQGTDLIKSAFVKTGNRIGFNVGRYDKRKQLVIDPDLVWGTYFGANGTDWCEGRGITLDATGNVLVTGVTTSFSDIASQGSYQANYGGGGEDAFIAKFSGDGKRLWSTYFGGNASDAGYGIVTDISGNVYVSGGTYSSSEISSSGAFQTSFGGTTDAFLAKFTSSGNRIWSTYFGGSGDDESYGIALDTNRNIYLTGETSSSNGIATSGAYRTSFGGGRYDAFLAKFNNNGGLTWATYYGGSGYDFAHGVKTDTSGNIYIEGYTSSGNNIATAGAWQTTNLNTSSAFLAKFTSDGSILWSTYYGETDNEGAEGLVVDVSGNVYITGSTVGDSGIATSGTYQTYNAGGIDVFIAKFSPNGTRLWGTFFGGKNSDFPYSIASNNSGDIFITGYTYSDSGIASQGAYLSTMGGGATVFIAQFSSNGKRIWSTYYGDDGTETGNSIVADEIGNIFITGETNNTSGIATAGAYQSSLVDGKLSAFIAKFDTRFQNDIGIPGFISPLDSICPAKNYYVEVILKNYGTDTFVSYTIHWMVNGKVQIPITSSVKIIPGGIDNIGFGTYVFLHDGDTIVVWTQLRNAVDMVPENDTAKIVVHFYKDHFPGIGQTNYSICKGSHIRLGNNPATGYEYQWSSKPAGFTSTLSNPIVNPDSLTTYYLTETNTRTGCTNTDTSIVNVKVVKAPVANAGKSHIVCFGDSTLIGSSPVSGLSYSWSSDPAGFSSTLSAPFVKPFLSGIYTVQVTNSTGCTDINNDTITVSHPLAITGQAQTVCSGTTISLGTTAIPGHIYSWTSKPSGFVSSISDPTDIVNQSTRFYLTETIVATGCSASDSVLITVVPRPNVKILADSLDAFNWKFSAVNPNYPANMYLWGINGADSLYSYNLYHKFQKIGTYEVSLTVEDSGNCTITDTIAVNINSHFSLDIFPNPFNNNADIRYILDHPAHIKITVYDMLGKEISALVNAQQEIGEYNTSFYAGNLHSKQAMYLVVFIKDDLVITKKIIQVGSVNH